MSDPVAERLEEIQARIAAAAARGGRTAGDVTLVGAAKRQPAAAVVASVAAGLRHVGESFAQEARDKIPVVEALLAERGLPSPCWHFLGRLQRNKARLVAPRFQWVESLDGIALAKELDRRAAAAGHALQVLIQVNLSDEPQKGGVPPDQVEALLGELERLSHLRPCGLMTVPAAADDPERSRPAFARLRKLRDTLRKSPEDPTLRELSMGMSADYEVAIEEGASIVRVGTALFGPREG